MNGSRDDHSPCLETDGRFVSGMWRGFYVQWGSRGKQELSLTFFDGQIVGDGADPAGDFRVRGGYDVECGKVWIHKVYPTHTVEYDGHAEHGSAGEVAGGIWGAWQIRYGFSRDHGGFHIWPEAQAEGAHRSLKQTMDVPAGRERAAAFAGVGSGGEEWSSAGGFNSP